MAQGIRTLTFPFMFVSALSTRHSTLDTRPFSLDYPIRSCQHIWRNRETDLLGRFQINDELELRRLLDGEVGGLSAFQNLIHIDCGTAAHVEEIHAVKHKAPVFYKPLL